MPRRSLTLASYITRLETLYGPPQPPPARGLFQLLLWELSVYLQPDERRAEVFAAFKKSIGLRPKDILAAPRPTLLALAKHGGMHPEKRVERWVESAQRVVDEHMGDLDRVRELPLREALRALQRFPSIGKPGAEKLLLLTDTHPLPALESNGMRVLQRLGYGEESKNYDTTYCSVQAAVKDELPATCAAWKRAHLLLRRHGQELCKNSAPLCDECPLSEDCPTGRET